MAMKKRTKKLINQIVNNISLSKKYVYSNIIIIIIPCIILAAVFFIKIQDTVQTEINNSYEQVMNQYADNILYKLKLYHNIEKAFSVNRGIQEILKERNIDSPMDVMQLIDKFSNETKSIFLTENQSEVYNITLYTYDENLSYNGEFLRSIKYVREEEWYIDIIRTNSYYNCFYNTRTTDNQNLLLLSYPIIELSSREGNRLGIIQLSLYANRIFAPESNTLKKEMDILILDKHGNTVYGDASKSELMHGLMNDNKNHGVIENGHSKKIYIYKSLSPYSLYAVGFFPYNEINSKVDSLVVFSIIIVSIIFALSLMLTIFFSHIFTRRIHLLVGKMKQVEDGNLNIICVIEGEDEVGLLDRQFNSMTQRLNNEIRENYMQKLERREAELNALQLQINPHFLYNTLESISAIAAINSCFDICSISQKLGDMFRYNINTMKHEFVYLSDEINHIKNYIYIQQIRFEGRFEVQYDIPEVLMDCKIIKFILQPVVENALNHGFEDTMEKGMIIISAGADEHLLSLTITDNGTGIPPDKVKQLNSDFNIMDAKINNHTKKGIGLKNVNSRIKLINGDAYGLTIRSQLHKGTQVIISLPLFKEAREDWNV